MAWDVGRQSQIREKLWAEADFSIIAVASAPDRAVPKAIRIAPIRVSQAAEVGIPAVVADRFAAASPDAGDQPHPCMRA